MQYIQYNNKENIKNNLKNKRENENENKNKTYGNLKITVYAVGGG